GRSCEVAIGLYRQVMRRLLAVSGIILLGMVCGTPWLIGVFHLEGPGPLYAAMLVCVSTLAMTTFQGVLQGTERFGWYGVSMNCWFWGRLLFAALLVVAGFRATGALAGMTLGALAGVIIPRLLLHRELFAGRVETPSSGTMRPLYRYIAKVTLAYALFMVLANMDVIAVKHWFSPEVAGEFSRGAMLAHLIWLMPFPVVMAMFPKLVAARNDQGARRRLLLKGIAVGAGTSLVLAGVLLAYSPYIFHILFGSPSNEMIGHMPIFLSAMLPVSFLFVLLNYELALNKRAFLGPLMVGNLLLIGALCLRHGSIEQILKTLLIGCWLLFAAQILFFLIRYKINGKRNRK
ncbi:MAG: oligosaccharide flippase family protein, partial [Kiritimatiellae bacterium]|nr:oligosaccharide flippase family protein [Kiritimatiellia bacterium]